MAAELECYMQRKLWVTWCSPPRPTNAAASICSNNTTWKSLRDMKFTDLILNMIHLKGRSSLLISSISFVHCQFTSVYFCIIFHFCGSSALILLTNRMRTNFFLILSCWIKQTKPFILLQGHQQNLPTLPVLPYCWKIFLSILFQQRDCWDFPQRGCLTSSKDVSGLVKPLLANYYGMKKQNKS